MAIKIVLGSNDLNTVNPTLASQWNWEKNLPLTPFNVSAGSTKKVYWIGKCGHEWQATIASRNHGVGCPICAKAKISENIRNAAVKRSGSLLDTNPTLAAEYAQDLNGSLRPADISANSHMVVWWRARCGHTWQTSVKNRNSGSNCPFCSNNVVKKGFNDLATINPNLASEWHPTRNTRFTPCDVVPESSRIVWWKGKCGHEWLASIKARNSGEGCLICSEKQINPSRSLAYQYPDLAKEWHPTKNGNLKAERIACGSHQKVWWLCENNHEWQASPNHRTSQTRGCPFCANNPRALKGYNDLATMLPDMADQWYYDGNGELLPSDVTVHSNKKVWWICAKGHIWKTAVNHRTNGSECPICQRAYSTSFPEQAIFFYIKQVYPDAENGCTDFFQNHGMELDVYIPSKQIGIEYDGYAFHRTKEQRERDLRKYEICLKKHIKLIRIREDKAYDDEKSSDILLFTEITLDETIKKLSSVLPLIDSLDINTDRDQLEIKTAYYNVLEKNSFAMQYPILAKEWNDSKNNGLSPAMFSPHSKQTVWWKCNRGHEWKAQIDARVRGTGCPYCTNHKVLSGFNDLATKRPELLTEWDYDKNISLNPSLILPGSGKKAWWKCSNGHQWEAEISSRNKGHGCPVCARMQGTINSWKK